MSVFCIIFRVSHTIPFVFSELTLWSRKELKAEVERN